MDVKPAGALRVDSPESSDSHACTPTQSPGCGGDVKSADDAEQSSVRSPPAAAPLALSCAVPTMVIGNYGPEIVGNTESTAVSRSAGRMLE